MRPDSMQEKTAVFTFGSLAEAEEPRSFDLDEPTRELPLIAGRFAGREWTPEDLRRELAEKDTLTGKALRRRRTAALAVGALCAMLLLVLSLVGQARLVERNTQTVAAAQTVSELRKEQSRLLVEYERTRLRAGSGVGVSAADNSRVQLLRQAQSEFPETEAEDTITVINVRRGRELQHFWHTLVDTLGVSFR